MRTNTEILKWDTDFFGIGVARITEPHLLPEELANIILTLKNKGMSLLYWSSDLSIESKRAALINNGLYVDRRTIFAMNLTSKPYCYDGDIVVEEYTDSKVCDELYSLAIQSGHYSRYRSDPYMPDGFADRLYKTWIDGSVNHSLADAVLVARQEGKIVGMVTTRDKNGDGSIELIAVNKSVRGQGVGSKLVTYAQRWFLDHDLPELRVVTQGDNISACNLYKKCGYSIKEINNFYHFWLK